MITKLDTEHYTITLVGDTRQAPKPVRVYAPYVTPDMEQPAYTIKGEDKALDAAWRKYNREEVRLMGVELEAALEELAAASNLATPETMPHYMAAFDALGMNRRFSRKAGCSCPCSPGFVGERRVFLPVFGYLLQVSVNRKPVAVEPERTFTMADFDGAGL